MTILQPFDPFLFTFSYQQDTYVLLSNTPVTFAPLPYPSSKRPPLLNHQLEAGAGLGTAKNETRGLSSSSIANLLSLYGKNTFNALSLRSDHYSQNMPLRPSSFSRSSVSRCGGVSTNTGTTTSLHCPCLSYLNAQPCGSEYAHGVLFNVDCIRCNVIVMEAPG